MPSEVLALLPLQYPHLNSQGSIQEAQTLKPSFPCTFITATASVAVAFKTQL